MPVTSLPPKQQAAPARPTRAAPAERENGWKEFVGRTVLTAYGLSLLVHLVLLIVASLVVLPTLVTNSAQITTVFDDKQEDAPFEDIMDLQVNEAGAEEEQILPQKVIATKVDDAAIKNLLSNDMVQDDPAATSEGEAGKTGIGSGGFRMLEPANAVRKGSFTAWTIPIPRHGEKTEPGQSPKPGQDYHIVIQVQVPDHLRAYPVSDLRGEVIGTDGYELTIPKNAFHYDEQGRLFPLRGNRKLPITDGVVQILIRVPGARRLVRDTITIESRRLEERQQLALIFGKDEDG